jgi:hypothetical protein
MQKIVYHHISERICNLNFILRVCSLWLDCSSDHCYFVTKGILYLCQHIYRNGRFHIACSCLQRTIARGKPNCILRSNYQSWKTTFRNASSSDVRAWLGLKALGWAWLSRAWACNILKPSPKPSTGLGLGLAWAFSLKFVNDKLMNILNFFFFFLDQIYSPLWQTIC